MDYLAEAFYNSLYSLGRVFWGTSMALVIGLALGLLRSQLPTVIKKNLVVRFLLEAGKYPPPIAWIPFVILLFGIGNFAASVIVFIGALSPIFTNTFEGIEKIPRILRDTMETFEVPPLKRIHVLLMTALPQIFAGIRIAISMGWMSVIAAEMISGQNGLGYSIQVNRLNMQYSAMLTDIVCIGGIGFLLNSILNSVERYVLVWHESV